MLAQYSHIWDGDLGRIKETKNRIELPSKIVITLHSETNRTGPTVRELENVEIENMFYMKVIEPTQI